MATVTGLTAARMLLIEGASIVNASISSFVLTLTRQNGTTINLGNIRGSTGATGATGPAGSVDTVNGKSGPDVTLIGSDIPIASQTARGTLELATTTEVAAASSTTLAVAPGTMGSHPGVAAQGIAAGTLAATSVTASGGTIVTTVTFPVGRFTAIPTVVATPIGALLDCAVAIDSVTATQVVIRRSNYEASARSFGATWFAVA